MWHKGSTPIKINVFENYLAEYNNRGVQSYYYQDLNMALDFSILAPVYLYGQTNLISVETHKAETQIKLDKEIKMGRVLGPFSEKSLHNF